MSCNEPSQGAATAKKEKPQEEMSPFFSSKEAAEELTDNLQRILGISFVESLDLKDGQVSIKYFGTFDAYKKTYPESAITAEVFDNYWTDQKIEKLFASTTASLIKSDPKIQSVNITLPANGKTYTGVISKKDLEELTGLTFDQMEKNWFKSYQTNFTTNPEGRKQIFDKFVQVK